MTQSAHFHGAWDDDGTWTSRLAANLGHHASELLIASIGAAVILGLRPLPGAFGVTVPVALFGFVIASWLLMRAHDRRLCEACMSAMPLDAAKQATKYTKRFWTAHTGSEPRFLIPYLVVLLGSNFAAGTVGRIFWAAMQLSMVYLILAQSTHRRLQPWCPWCKGGGGGEDVDETPPVLPRDDRQLI
ncbi:hypothetical protein [uncultured Jatrophihabitans sp.]|uniref:hypothetical protein n=1 Tax=uncultured Jatrophihabitans sp. TaxID=1610747 RepID=UPI0035C9E3EC